MHIIHRAMITLIHLLIIRGAIQFVITTNITNTPLFSCGSGVMLSAGGSVASFEIITDIKTAAENSSNAIITALHEFTLQVHLLHDFRRRYLVDKLYLYRLSQNLHIGLLMVVETSESFPSTISTIPFSASEFERIESISSSPRSESSTHKSSSCSLENFTDILYGFGRSI